MGEGHISYRPERRDQGDGDPGRWYGPVALVFAGTFAAAALVFVVFAAATRSHVETTTYYAAAALLFVLLTVGTLRERARARRGESEKRRQDGPG
ncbi:hypothetical protein [Streptacidiphilus monticola]|uniref:YiaAB two helix domain-containing protein n=1 Tax=Streptacidiphilus monticola TaxID=2161674 RepID=A0ABW1G0L3_9ACTN